MRAARGMAEPRSPSLFAEVPKLTAEELSKYADVADTDAESGPDEINTDSRAAASLRGALSFESTCEASASRTACRSVGVFFVKFEPTACG